MLSVSDGIARIHGLENAMSLEMLELPHDVVGLALNLESDNVGAVLFGDWEDIAEGDIVKRTGELLEVPVGEGCWADGRSSRPAARRQGRDQGQGEASGGVQGPRRRAAPTVKEPLQTGLKAVDSMIPIGRGQRELIIGDRQTGKTTIALDTIINNRDTGVVSVYVAIGQRMSAVVQLAETLREAGALDKSERKPLFKCLLMNKK